MDHKRIVLPPEILDFVYFGGDASRRDDHMMSHLMNLTRDFATYSVTKGEDLEHVIGRIEACTIEMEVRTAAARLLQTAYYIAAGNLAMAATSFDSAKQLFDSAHARSQGTRMVTVYETSVLQSLAVVGYQLRQAQEAAAGNEVKGGNN